MHTKSQRQSVLGRQAVVIGAGIAGLAAARALEGFFNNVIIVERDQHIGGEVRPGVPQGRQSHLLMAGGFRSLSQLFPGLGKALRREGAIPLEVGSDLVAETPGLEPIPRRNFQFDSFATTRPLLEAVLREQVLARCNVRLMSGCTVRRLTVAEAEDRVDGVEFEDSSGAIAKLEGDLIVDASGLAAVGAASFRNEKRKVQTSRIGVDLGWATAMFRIPDNKALDFVAMVTLADVPKNSRSGYMQRVGPQLWQVLLSGRGDGRPTDEPARFLEFSRTLPTPTIGEALKEAELIGDIAVYRFRESRCLHLDRVTDLPKRLIMVGDAVCRFNPIYGQGMTVAAHQACALHLLAGQNSGDLDGLVSRYLLAAKEIIAKPWAMSTIQDFCFPDTIGEAPADLNQRVFQEKMRRQLAVTDPEVHRAMLEDIQLIPAGLKDQEAYTPASSMSGTLRM